MENAYRLGAAARIANELLALETILVRGIDAHATTLGSIVADAHASGDAVLRGQALCLQGGFAMMRGNYGEALERANEALLAFADPQIAGAPQTAGLVAEAYRGAGAALIRLGRVADALPQLEEAVRIARAHVLAPPAPPPYATLRTAPAALLRSLITLGVAFASIREIDTAIEMYTDASDVAQRFPQLRDHHADDILMARLNSAEALRERSAERAERNDAEGAADDLGAAGRILEKAARQVADSGGSAPSPYLRAGYFSAFGHHLLVTAKPAEAIEAFERQALGLEQFPGGNAWFVADAHAGIARALLDLGRPADALARSDAAIATLDAHDEPQTRIAALRIRAAALAALGQHEAAYATRERLHGLRVRLEAAAARHRGSDLAARIALERARSTADVQRRMTRTLEVLNAAGREITGKLDADSIFGVFAERVCALLPAAAVRVWRVDPGGTVLQMRFATGFGPEVPLADVALSDRTSPLAAVVREARGSVVRPAPTLGAATILEPLVAEGRVIGVVCVHAGRDGALDEDDAAIVGILAGHVVIALTNATAFAELRQTANVLLATHSELSQRTTEFERLSLTDTLTGLANRRHLVERARAVAAAHSPSDARVAVAIFDLDHFKAVNDTYGHAIGDAVLVEVSRRAKSLLRPADLIARIGGEEFALLLPDTAANDAQAVAERIRANIAEAPIDAAGTRLAISASFGVTTFAADSESFENALSRADAALYTAKQGGRNRVQAAEAPA